MICLLFLFGAFLLKSMMLASFRRVLLFPNAANSLKFAQPLVLPAEIAPVVEAEELAMRRLVKVGRLDLA